MPRIISICLFSILFSLTVGSQNLYFPPASGEAWDTMAPLSLGWCEPQIDSLYDFLETNNTHAFILLKDGKIVLEKYFGNFQPNDSWYWASAGKGITSFMVGVAQQEGYLSLADPTSEYLGLGWTSLTPEQEEQITIWHQLTMTTGLDDGVEENHCTLDTCLVFLADPATRWAYHNAPYTLLDQVIFNATGTSLNQYTNQKLKVFTGMTGLFLPVGYNNVYFSNARSMARFGLLMLNGGVWDGISLMTDTAYFQQMTNTSQSLNEAYGYLWWLNGKSTYMIPQLQFVFNGSFSPNAPDDMYAALGMNGQIINVVPSENMVWIRMGDSPDGSLIPYMINDQIWEYINILACDPTSVDWIPGAGLSIEVYPNPAREIITLVAEKPLNRISLFNALGQEVSTIRTDNLQQEIPLSALMKGVYLVVVSFADGTRATQKILRE